MIEFILKAVERDPVERSRAIAKVCEAMEALLHQKAWRVRIERYRHERSDAQNAYLWAVPYKLLADRTGFESDELHEYFCGQVFGWKDKRIPKTPRNPTGIISIPCRSTTRDENGERDVLTWDQFSDFWAYVQRFAAQKLDMVIPDPDPMWREKKARTQ